VINIPKLKEKPLQLYEVIRVIEKVPLFLEDHLERFYQSAALNHIHNLPEQEKIREKILTFIQDEDQRMGNLKLTFTLNDPDISPEMDLVFIPHFYPPEEKYITGVKVGTLIAERPNPQAKSRIWSCETRPT
jgi:branched-chain amino acid aminotransferase